MIPGPTTVHNRVRKVMSDPQVGHSSKEFYEAFVELLQLTRKVYKSTKGHPFVITGSGTIAMEATAMSLIEPDDPVVVLDTGHFGQRFELILNAHGAKVDTLRFKFGNHAEPKALQNQLAKKRYKAVFMTHVDTSSTVANPVKELVRIAKDAGALAIVDAVCSLGGIEIDFDNLGADVILSASQKALGAPPGAALMMLSQGAIDSMGRRKVPIRSYYLNLLRWKPIMEDPKMYLATPAVQIMLALKEALTMVLEEGLESRWERHRKLAEAVRAGLAGLDLSFIVEEGYRANTVTGIHVPKGKAGQIQSSLKYEYNVEVARGFGDLKEDALRIGHFANVDKMHVTALLSGMEMTLRSLGVDVPRGVALEAASKFLLPGA